MNDSLNKNPASLIDKVIEESLVDLYKSQIGPAEFSYEAFLHNPFENLLSLGELVDRLTIVNNKLFHLKNEVIKRLDDHEFKAWQAEMDIKLVEERARLKRCIDQKVICMVQRTINSDTKTGFIEEVKKYG